MQAAIEAIGDRFLRTTRHPAVTVVGDATSFDELYETADTFDDVYRRIAEALLAAAVDRGEVLYAVPGSPRVLERSVDHLVRAAGEGSGVEVEVQPALSFLDLAGCASASIPSSSACGSSTATASRPGRRGAGPAARRARPQPAGAVRHQAERRRHRRRTGDGAPAAREPRRGHHGGQLGRPRP